MASVECEVEEVEILNEEGRSVAGVLVTCSRCGHEATAYGTSAASVRHALATLHETCPENESNFYEAADGEDQD